MRFTKMQGAGNDYLYIDCTRRDIIENPARLSVAMSDRHFGAGADGIVLICPSDSCDFRMRIFNADGSEAEMCGNASRCIGKYVYERKLTDKTKLTLETGAGTRYLTLHLQDGKVETVTVDMGEPSLSPTAIPVLLEGERVTAYPLKTGLGNFSITAVSMGNPHAVIFVKQTDRFDVEGIGKLIENHPVFPKRTNVEFIEVTDRSHFKMRVWERGSGETWACGTGACASVVAGVLNGICERKVQVELRGGTLEIEWNETNNRVYMTGGAEIVYDGEWPGSL